MLDQDREGRTGATSGAREADHSPVRQIDAAYLESTARWVEKITGKLPLWYTATPEELAEATRQQWENRGLDGPDIPLEALRRENMYD
jgi:hypothetical protein